MSGQLVEQWPITTLGELCEVITKGTTPTSVGFQFEQKGINFVKIESITREGTIIESKLAKINQDCHDKLKRSQLQEGDILFSIAGALGRTTLVTKDILPANTNQALAIIRLIKSEKVLPEYVLKALSTGYTLSQIEKYRGGAAQQNLSLTQMKAFKIPLPPLGEQQRIVNILDKAFNKLAKKSERIEQQILSIDNLFDGVLDSEYANQSEWNLATLDEIIESTFYGPRFAKDAYTPDGIVSLRTTDMADDGLFEFKDPPRIPLDAKQLEKYRLIDGDILIARSGSVGKCAIYTEDLGEAMPSAYLIRMRLKKGLVHPRFVLRYLLSRTGQGHLIGHSTSSTMANINSKNLRNIPFSYPSLAEQMRIIEKLDGLHYESKNLKQTYHSGLNNLVELKQSILQEAFNGTL